MGKRLEYTPRSRIKAALRQLSLRSREHAACRKRENNTCQECGRKGSVAKGKEVKTEIHHINGINWKEIIEYIYKELLVHPDKLKLLCKDCHDEETVKQKKENTDEITT